MNRVIEVHGGRRLIIPVGLPELMNDIGKEVIKHQPENLLEFIANYLERRVQQLKRRDPLRKDSSAYAEIEQSLPRETRMILDDCGIDLYTAVKAVTTIQATFRGFQTRKRLKKEKYDRESYDNGTPPDNVEMISEKPGDSMLRATVEKSSCSTLGSSFYNMPMVDYKTSKPSIDVTSTYEQVSLMDYEGADDYSRYGTICDRDRMSNTNSMISTNTITRDMQQESNTYLDLTEVYRKSLDPFKEVEQTQAPAALTSDLEIFKHIDLEEYEDTKKAFEHVITNNNQEEGGYSKMDDQSISQQSGSTQRYSTDQKSSSPRASDESPRRSQEKGDDLEEKFSQDNVSKSPRSSSENKPKDDGDEALEFSGKLGSNEDVILNMAETGDE